MIKATFRLLVDFAMMLSGVLAARWLMRLSSPQRDWTDVVHAYKHVRASLDFALLKLHLPNRFFSLFHIDRLLQLRMKVYFANGGFADDR